MVEPRTLSLAQWSKELFSVCVMAAVLDIKRFKALDETIRAEKIFATIPLNIY